MWLVKCVKTLILEQPSTVNMIKGVKHCWNVWNTAETVLNITNTAEMCTTALLSIFFIALQNIEL